MLVRAMPIFVKIDCNRMVRSTELVLVDGEVDNNVKSVCSTTPGY